MLKFDCHIKGVAPLLFNRFPEEENPDDGTVGPKGPKIPPADLQVYKSLYWLEPIIYEDFVKLKETNKKTGTIHYKIHDNSIYTPAEHVIGSMIKAATNFKLEGKKTFKDVIKAGAFIEPLKISHLKNGLVRDWRPVVIPRQRARVMAGRGRLDEWELKFQLTCIDPRARERDLEDILKYAGMFYGLGDYRPRYGRFEVVKMVKI